MSEPEGFLSRWTRLKRETGEASKHGDTPADAARADASAPEAVVPPAPASEHEPPAFDLSALPPIESITATTDIRAFLAPGVPAELTRAALRRAWVADPQIRDFIGIAENQWDFTDPNSIPGFGTFDSAEEVRRLVARVVGGENDEEVTSAVTPGHDLETPRVETAAREGTPPQLPHADRPHSEGSPAEPSRLANVVQCSEDTTESAAMQKDEQGEPASPVPRRHGHGGALPR